MGNGYRLYVMRDLNGRTGNMMRDGTSGTFLVPRGSENRRRVVYFLS